MGVKLIPAKPNLRTRSQVALFVSVTVAALAFISAPKLAGAEQAGVNFNRDVRPILSDNCFACHGPDENDRKGKLRLDTREGAVKSAVVPGSADESELIKRLVTTDEDDLMPPPKLGKKVTPEQIDILKRWIKEGAEYEKHWAFIAPKRPSVPPLKNPAAAKNAIDHFVQARLESEGLKPSPEADRVTLIRRVSLDLIGLPPTVEEVEAFVEDTSPFAYERVVERLLRSPHFGERWGRHWLDVARYADSNGYSIDAPRQIWKYRDWVIDAMNADKPFDQFVVEQMAGDMLPNATIEQKIATGFHRNTQINEEGGIDKEQFRIESIIDRVSTTGSAFLGLTIACSQCHDHKFDPLPQKDFFGLYAFLNNADEPTLPLATEEQLAAAKEIEEKAAAYIAAIPEKDPEIWTKLRAWEEKLPLGERQAMSEQVRMAFDVKPTERTEAHKLLLLTAFIEKGSENKKAQSDLRAIRAKKPKFDTTLVLQERAKPRRSYLFVKGDFTRDGGEVEPSVPGVLHPLKPTGTTNRLDLANWIVDRENPLLARVTVNRIWQQYFGRGLVETENDFGTQGSLPTHPELLDWLATEFMGSEGSKNAWSQKHIHRLIVTSATYRQSSRGRPDLEQRDAMNKLLARQKRLRLDAELVRDSILTASGLLNREIGGPSVFPPQPDGVMNLGQQRRAWNVSKGDERFRRGMYTHFWRATPHPALAVFDAPDSFATCTRRNRSNTPLQALTLLNDAQFYEMATLFAGRLLEMPAENDGQRLEKAFQLCLSRKPDAEERAILQRTLAAASQGNTREGAWTLVARTLLNLDETITRE